MQRRYVCLAAVVLCLTLPARARAQFGGSQIVFDPNMFARQLQQLQQETSTVTNLAQQLQYAIKNTTGGGAGVWAAFLGCSGWKTPVRARQGSGIASALTRPAVASQFNLSFACLISPPCTSPCFNSSRAVYGVAATSCCRSRSSSNSKSEYIS